MEKSLFESFINKIRNNFENDDTIKLKCKHFSHYLNANETFLETNLICNLN